MGVSFVSVVSTLSSVSSGRRPNQKLYVEGYGRTPEQVEALRPYGLEMVTTWAPGFFFGGAQAAQRRPDGAFEVAADHVRRGSAGYLA